MPWIENVARADIEKGFHHAAGPNSMLISIRDPATFPPVPIHQFKEMYCFEFLDLEDKDDEVYEEAKITQEDATILVKLLQRALDNDMNVVVHCYAGVCRSGAVAEVGTMMGFDDVGRWRAPNMRVKRMMMAELGWTYNNDE